MDLPVAVDEDKNTDNDTKDSINLETFKFKEILGQDGTRKVIVFFFLQ